VTAVVSKQPAHTNGIIERMLGAVRFVFGFVAATMIALTSHGDVTALVIGGLFQKGYRERAPPGPEGRALVVEHHLGLAVTAWRRTFGGR
jgi:hypothetical protein